MLQKHLRWILLFQNTNIIFWWFRSLRSGHFWCFSRTLACIAGYLNTIAFEDKQIALMLQNIIIVLYFFRITHRTDASETLTFDSDSFRTLTFIFAGSDHYVAGILMLQNIYMHCWKFRTPNAQCKGFRTYYKVLMLLKTNLQFWCFWRLTYNSDSSEKLTYGFWTVFGVSAQNSGHFWCFQNTCVHWK